MTISSKVSVILTSYNHAKYLRESIESVLNQTYKDFELIIWDDASTDDSWNIILSYPDKRIRAFRNETNQFVEYLRKAISEVAKGEYIALHHSDDVWESQKLERQVAFLDAHPEIGAVFSNALIVGENNETFEDKSHFYYKIFDQPNRTRHEWLNYFFYQGNALCHPSVLIRKICYDKCGLYRYGLAQLPDFDMWVRLCLKYEIHVMPEKLVRFRVLENEANASGNRPEAQIRGQFEFLQLFNNYCTIESPEEFLNIFPTAQKYFIQKDYDLGFALGMVALDSNTSNVIKLFGLKLLFDALNNSDRANKIMELYDFTQKDFVRLTGQHDVFSIGLIPNLYMQLAEKERGMQVLANRLEEKKRGMQVLANRLEEEEQIVQTLSMQVTNLQSQLHEILHSKVWKTALLFRQIRLWIAPPNSMRARLWEFITSPTRYRKIWKDIALINSSDLFDRKWYVSKYPAVKNIDPARHYLQFGGFEGLNPSPYFNSNWYLSTHPDVKMAGINPLLHYLKYGEAEGYSPKPQKPPPDVMASLHTLLTRLGISNPIDEIVSALSEYSGYNKTMTNLVEVETFLSRAENRKKYPLIQASQLPEISPTAGKKNILFITSEFPDRHHGGGNRVLNFIEELSKRNNIYLCTAFSQSEHEIHLRDVEQYCKSILKIPFERFGGNQAEIREWLHGIPMDTVHYEWIFSLKNYGSDLGQFQIFTYMEAVSLRLLMDMEQLQPLSEAWLDKFQQLSDALLFELVLAAPLDTRVAVTSKDGEFFQKLFPFQEYVVLNHGLDFENFTLPDVEPEPQTLAFIGNFKHYPNVNAMHFFFNKVWEDIRKEIPQVCIYIVGTTPPLELMQLADGKSVIVTGAVPDVRRYIQSASVCIAPLVSGAGLRGKVIEYAALRRTFVATSIAIEDLVFEDGVDYFCADTPEEFSQRIISLLKTPELARQMAESAYNTARKNYDTKRLTGYLLSLYQYLENKADVK